MLGTPTVIASAAKQSSAELIRNSALDCFAALAMTGLLSASGAFAHPGDKLQKWMINIFFQFGGRP
jgi:hypothetical protein